MSLTSGDGTPPGQTAAHWPHLAQFTSTLGQIKGGSNHCLQSPVRKTPAVPTPWISLTDSHAATAEDAFISDHVLGYPCCVGL